MLPVFARIRRETEGIDIKVSTRLMVNATDWEKGHKDAVSLTRFRSREPALFEKLDAIERALSSLLDMGGIDSQAAADRIGEIVYAEEIAKEAERERRRQEEENAARLIPSCLLVF